MKTTTKTTTTNFRLLVVGLRGATAAVVLYALTLLTTACEKKDGTLLTDLKAKGTVIDATTKKPIPNARIGLEQVYSPALFSVSRSWIGYATADEGGKFEIKADRRKKCSYYLSARADNYFEYYVEGIEVREPTVLFKDKVTLTLTPKAWVRVKLNHVSDYDQGNGYQITFSGEQYFVRGGGGFPRIDTTVLLLNPIKGNTNFELGVDFDINGETVKYLKIPVFAPAFDTVTVNLEF